MSKITGPEIAEGGAPIEKGIQLAGPEYTPESKPIPAPEPKLHPCPVNPKHGTTPVQLQGDPHIRCGWCHAILDE